VKNKGTFWVFVFFQKEEAVDLVRGKL